MIRGAWDPTCSFCGARPPAELVRADGRDYWICADCIDHPVIHDSVSPGTLCTFCQVPLSDGSGASGAARVAVAARRSTVLCSECLPVCVHLIGEGRALKARRFRQGC
jgi:hypothetical protein